MSAERQRRFRVRHAERYQRMRDALVKIAELDHDAVMRQIAREALGA